MISKTLDDKVIISLGTAGMRPGYVITQFYHNSLGVFSGRTYLETSGDTLSFCLNDIIKQNRGPIDYIKLNDNGEVETIPLVNDTYGAIPYQYRFKQGQCGRYGVQIEQVVNNVNIYYNDWVNVLSAYSYPNKNLKCRSMQPQDNSTDLDRIMQGTNWVYDHDEEIGDFENLLLPHYPKVKTKKYGFGLQLHVNEVNPRIEYSLRRKLGNEVAIGSPIFFGSSQTFLRLEDLINGTYSQDSEYLNGDDYVWLKLSGTSGDEFGDFEEAYTYYNGDVMIDHFLEIRTIVGQESESFRRIYRNSERFKTVLNDYIEDAQEQLEIPQSYNTLNNWNVDKITANASTAVYSAFSRYSEQSVIDDLSTFESYYERVLYNQVGAYIYYLEPVFSDVSRTIEVPDSFLGTCPVAILDTCYSRYYLAWYDRYGDVQSQAFDGKIVYSEDIENDEVQDYLERRRVSNISITPKWELNTKWLNDNIYPLYESIYSSPYLLLYDTEQDKSWNVIISDKKYQEKKYKNDKLFNLTLNVEANENQNLIY